MKHSIIPTIIVALSISGSISAQTTASQTQAQANQDAKSSPAKKAQPSTIQPVVIPKEAVANPDGSFSYTDKNGKKWIYGQTPFGISKVEDMRGTNTGASTTSLEQLIKTTDNGDAVKFERQTPFGTVKWERKKSELTDQERTIYEKQHPQTQPEQQQTEPQAKP